ncbi:nucleoside triphosphate pyrophosphohydrolase [Corallincola holothuriorum]|uniref:Nucleoside triphosphate pyrophosphohydrolase n=1 Tax=Corallincola holothuriorum TaxID=2282215 RepID=A0A368NMS1_9GAMM|nr:nucleoside triphosphate pyrophosphohydrolase [Corallincola holothuriorum]RCU51867.1 nucleoside triphosphate pyrophosphohydrolase [Corallincola holothuriorum]
MSNKPSIDKLVDIMAQLRDPLGGCPWDLKQSFTSIVPYTLEEAYEVAHAIETEDWPEVQNELGDLLFQVVFYAQLGKEQGLFDFDAIVDGVSEKLVRRHPHVFAQLDVADEAEIKKNWENFKAAERAEKSQDVAPSALDDVPAALPALSRAAKLQKRAAHQGFDWPDISGVVDKLAEEQLELVEALASDDMEHIAEELGDLLFTAVNLARHLKKDPEQLLRQANNKFENRFRYVEKILRVGGKELSDYSLEQLENAWCEAKTELNP